MVERLKPAVNARRRRLKRIRRRAKRIDMKTRIIPLLICILAISAQVAHAGPANRRAVATGNPPNVPINLNGFGAPLPGVTSIASDLADFASGQMNFKEVETLPQVGPLMNGVSCACCHSQ